MNLNNLKHWVNKSNIGTNVKIPKFIHTYIKLTNITIENIINPISILVAVQTKIEINPILLQRTKQIPQTHTLISLQKGVI